MDTLRYWGSRGRRFKSCQPDELDVTKKQVRSPEGSQVLRASTSTEDRSPHLVHIAPASPIRVILSERRVTPSRARVTHVRHSCRKVMNDALGSDLAPPGGHDGGEAGGPLGTLGNKRAPV